MYPEPVSLGPVDSVVEITVYGRNSIPLNDIIIPIHYAGEIALTLDSFFTDGCRTEFFQECLITNIIPSQQKVTIRLIESAAETEGIGIQDLPQRTAELEPGFGPILRVRFTIDQSLDSIAETTVDLSGYSINLPRFSGPLCRYQPGVLAGEVGYYGCCFGTAGNVDFDPSDAVDISDLVYLVDYMFAGGPAPVCLEETDVNASGGVDISDLVYLTDYMFTGGPAPVACP